MTAIDLDPTLSEELTKLLGSQIVTVEPESALNPAAVVVKLFLADGRRFRLNANNNQSKESSYLLPKYLVEQGISGEHFSILQPEGYLDEKRALVYEHIEGQTLRHLLPTITVEPWFVRVGQLLRRLHDTTRPNFLKMLPAADFIDSFRSTSQVAIKATEIANQLGSAPLNQICHGDPNPSNLLIDEKNDQLTLIDFSAAGLGDAMMDVAILLVHSQLAGALTGYEDAFWRGYGQVDGSASNRLKQWRALIFAHNALYIETWLSKDDPTREDLINQRLSQADKELR